MFALVASYHSASYVGTSCIISVVLSCNCSHGTGNRYASLAPSYMHSYRWRVKGSLLYFYLFCYSFLGALPPNCLNQLQWLAVGLYAKTISTAEDEEERMNDE